MQALVKGLTVLKLRSKHSVNVSEQTILKREQLRFWRKEKQNLKATNQSIKYLSQSLNNKSSLKILSGLKSLKFNTIRKPADQQAFLLY